MAKSAHIGMIVCPLCGSDQATVHEQQSGTLKGRRYMRCYETVGSNVMRCGTLQCLGPSGQDFVNANMRPIGQPDPAPGPIAQNPPPELPPEPPAPEPIDQPKRSPWAWLAGGDDDE